MMIDESVSVGMVDAIPKYMIWKGRNYTINQIGLHHHFTEGKTLYHIFSAISGTVFLRLKFNTDNLLWKLEEIGDELT